MKSFISFNKTLVYLITDGTATAQNFTEKKLQILKLIKTAVKAGIDLIQIREKRLAARLVFEIVSEAAYFARRTDTKILVNDRPDLALAANADGVHLTRTSLSAATIRRSFPRNFIVGVSAHTIEEAEIARRHGANFVTFSPIFPSPGKGDSQGVEKLKAVCERLKPFPVLALGGIDETNFAEILEAGAGGFAAIRFLNKEEALKRIAAYLCR